MLAGVLSLATQLNGGNVGPINPALYDELGPAGARDGIADGLERDGIQLTSVSTRSRYLLAGGFLPSHPPRLTIDGTFIATLTANPLGDVTYGVLTVTEDGAADHIEKLAQRYLGGSTRGTAAATRNDC